VYSFRRYFSSTLKCSIFCRAVVFVMNQCANTALCAVAEQATQALHVCRRRVESFGAGVIGLGKEPFGGTATVQCNASALPPLPLPCPRCTGAPSLTSNKKKAENAVSSRLHPSAPSPSPSTAASHFSSPWSSRRDHLLASAPCVPLMPFSALPAGQEEGEAEDEGALLAAAGGGGQVSHDEWQRWGTISPLPAAVTAVVRELLEMEAAAGEKMLFGGVGPKLKVTPFFSLLP
jgi:hypothetical protein